MLQVNDGSRDLVTNEFERALIGTEKASAGSKRRLRLFTIDFDVFAPDGRWSVEFACLRASIEPVLLHLIRHIRFSLI